MEDVLIPIFVACVMPIAIVLIVALRKSNTVNKRSEILIKAIEANKEVDTDKLIEAMKEPTKSPQEILNARLLRGCMFSLIGLALVIVGIVNLANGTEFSADPVTVPMMFGGISLAIGISYLIVYFVTRNQTETTEDK
ncbi:MAG: hypothetical protein K2L17_11820 [Muribaculaceae bacterium]|nr:hypothetical protein [Muribaculaceae bacterium]